MGRYTRPVSSLVKNMYYVTSRTSSRRPAWRVTSSRTRSWWTRGWSSSPARSPSHSLKRSGSITSVIEPGGLFRIRVDTKMPFSFSQKCDISWTRLPFCENRPKHFKFSYKISETRQDLYNYPALLPCLKHIFAIALGKRKYFAKINFSRENLPKSCAIKIFS